MHTSKATILRIHELCELILKQKVGIYFEKNKENYQVFFSCDEINKISNNVNLV